MLEIVGREADGDRRCAPVGCGTVLTGPLIDSGCGPVRIGAAAKARALDTPVEMPSCRLWSAARASRRASASACSWHRPAGAPFGPS